MHAADPSENQPPLCLDQFLKLHGLAGTGGQAKVMIQGGEVTVNGQVETRRRKKLSHGDVVEAGGEKVVVGTRRPGESSLPRE